MELRVTIFQRRVGRRLEWHTLGLGKLDRSESGPTQAKVQQRIVDGLRKAAEKLWPADLERLEPSRGRKIEVVRLEMNLDTGQGRVRFYGRVPLIVEPRATGPKGERPLVLAYHPLRPFEWFVVEPEAELADAAKAFFRTRWAGVDEDDLERLRAQQHDTLRLIAFSVSPHALEDKLLQKEGAAPALMGGGSRETGTELLSSLGTNETLRAIDGRLATGMPRSPLREQLQQLVCGRKKTSILLVGKSGVGKSTLLTQLVYDLLEADDFASHRNLDRTHAVWRIRGRRIIAGMMYLGQWEQRCVDLVEACRKHRGVLWIEDLDAWGRIGETRESDRSLSTFFRGPIARRELLVVAETTPEGLQRLQDDAPGLAASLTTVFVEPTDTAETMRMLVHEARKLEREHDIAFQPAAFKSILRLGGALSPGSAHPGNAIDLLRGLADTHNETPPNLLEAEREAKAGRKINAIKAFRAQVGAGLKDSKEAVESFLEKGHWPVPLPKPRQRKAAEVRSLRDVNFAPATGAGSVGPAEVVQFLSHRTGMPEVLLSGAVPLHGADVERALGGQIMGQRPAVVAMRDLVLRLKAGLSDAGRPYGVFLFTGPTGTGKTEMAKCVAEYLYGDGGRLLRFDMSEYGGWDAPSRLIGDRYTPSGTLTSAVKAQPFSVVLLDEIEKAAPSVLNLLLQLFDDGRLTDAGGQVVDFSHAVVIMTSNLGAKSSPSVGFGDASQESGKDVMAAVREFFPPELFNRIERVVQFASLSREAAKDIARRELTRLLGRRGLTERNVFVRFTDAVVQFVTEQGFSPRDGARSLKRYLEEHVGGFLADRISAQPSGGVRLLWLFVRDGELKVHQELLDEAEAAGDSSPIERLLALGGLELRATIPALRDQAQALLDSDKLEKVAAALSEEVDRFRDDAESVADGGAALELDQLRAELRGLLGSLEVQSDYDPTIADLRDPDAAVEVEGALLEAGDFSMERLAASHNERFVKVLDVRQIQPSLPLQNRADLLEAISTLLFIEKVADAATDPDSHAILIELTRVTRSGGASRFAESEPGLLEWLAAGYAGGRGRVGAMLAVDDGGEVEVLDGGRGLLTRSWARVIVLVTGPGVGTFYAGEHGCHIRESTTAGVEIVRVRVLPARHKPEDHLDQVRAEREAFVQALEHGDPEASLPAHPDAILPAVRRYHFDPVTPGELTAITVEDFELMYSTETRVRRLSDVLPTLWLLRLGAQVPNAAALLPQEGEA